MHQTPVVAKQVACVLQAVLPEAELRRSTRAASQAAAKAAAQQQAPTAMHAGTSGTQQQQQEEASIASPSDQATATGIDPHQLSAEHASGRADLQTQPQQHTADQQQQQQSEREQHHQSPNELAIVPSEQAEEEDDETQEPVLAIQGCDAAHTPAGVLLVLRDLVKPATGHMCCVLSALPLSDWMVHPCYFMYFHNVYHARRL